jgi:small-conductance mechanosensitive channel
MVPSRKALDARRRMDASVSDRLVTAVITASVGLLLIAAVRFAVGFASRRYLHRLEARRGPEEAASLRTRLTVLERVLVAFLLVVLAWQVLSIFPSTGRVANTVLASTAVIALLAGLAFTVPLGNLGAGIMLAFAQPVRIGDRVTVDDFTGTAERINLMHTVLLSDDERRIFIPNSKMVSSVVVNRTVKDLRRSVTVSVPVALTAPLDRAKSSVLESVRGVEGVVEASVRVSDVAQSAAWITVVAYASPTADVATLAGNLRERAVLALGREQLLPG